MIFRNTVIKNLKAVQIKENTIVAGHCSMSHVLHIASWIII